MHEATFEEGLELILAKDPRHRRDAYLFLRDALDFTQKAIVRENRENMRHVSGQELLAGIRDFALAQFGPMAITVFEEWGIRNCRDFGEIVFNMVEAGFRLKNVSPTARSFRTAPRRGTLVKALNSQLSTLNQFELCSVARVRSGVAGRGHAGNSGAG